MPSLRRASCSRAAMASLERRASLPPFSTQALPVFIESEKMSAVTLGRASQIMPTTPNGTRTLRRVMPLGRVHSAIVSPCGEGSPATDSMSAAIEAMRSAVSRRRSRMGESASIASRSRALAASTFPAFSRSRAAAFATVRLNRPASTRASSLPARRAATKIVSYSIFIPDIGNRSESAV